MIFHWCKWKFTHLALLQEMSLLSACILLPKWSSTFLTILFLCNFWHIFAPRFHGDQARHHKKVEEEAQRSHPLAREEAQTYTLYPLRNQIHDQGPVPYNFAINKKWKFKSAFHCIRMKLYNVCWPSNIRSGPHIIQGGPEKMERHTSHNMWMQ